MIKFCRIELRTTDAAGARDFYARILGHDRSVIWPLHEQALARGAPPHWLGTLGVEDMEGAAKAFVKRGATQLGPTFPTRDGGQAVILRDPGGAVVALATQPRANTETGVVWHVLNTNNAAQATTNYVEQFGWKPTDRIELGAHGIMQQFAWHAGGESVGAIGDIATRPGVHPHWLFFFEVDALDRSIAAVRAVGGRLIEPSTLPTGPRVCVCHDPQGAEFALWGGSAPEVVHSPARRFRPVRYKRNRSPKTVALRPSIPNAMEVLWSPHEQRILSRAAGPSVRGYPQPAPCDRLAVRGAPGGGLVPPARRGLQRR